MICPRCGAVSRVTETRDATEGMVRRRRECDNMHRFTTFEVYEQTVKAASLKNISLTWKKVQAAAKMWLRDRRIILDKRGNSAVADQLGLSEARVRQIRAAARATHPGINPSENPPGGSSAKQPQKGKRK